MARLSSVLLLLILALVAVAFCATADGDDAAAAAAGAAAASTPPPKPLVPVKDLPKRFTFVEAGELGTRVYNGSFLLPSKSGKHTVHINVPRRAAFKLHVKSDTRCQLDIVINGVLSSSFGGINYNIEQVLPKGQTELVFMFSRIEIIKQWYAQNKNWEKLLAEPEEPEEPEEADEDEDVPAKPKYPPHYVVNAELDFNKDTINQIAEKVRKQQENAVKKEIGSSDEL